MPLGMLIPTLGFVSCIFMLATLNLLIILPGLVFYFVGDTPGGERIRREIGRRLGRKVR